MALGDSYNKKNNGKERYQPTVYCPIQLKNPDASCDPSELSFSYWKNLLKVGISPKKQEENVAYATYDHDNQGCIYLNHDKARILYSEITEFLADPSAFNSRGVSTGSNGLITISNGKEFGVETPVLVIRKVDGESGTVTSSYMYQFKTDTYKAIRNFDETNMKYDTGSYEYIEIYTFLDILKSFYESMSYAVAYSVLNANQYNDSRMNTKLDLLMDKAGIERQSKGSSPARNNGRSFFNNMAKEGSTAAATEVSKTKSEQTTIDELAKIIG